METNDILEIIGLTKAESKVYLSLLSLGQSKSGKVIKNTNLQSSVVYNALNSLQEKGFISYILIGKLKEYKALNPEVLEKYLEAKQTELKKIIPKLKQLSNKEESSTAEIFEGYRGILNAMLYMSADAKKGEIYKYFAADAQLLNDEALNFFSKADIIRKEKNIILKGIAEERNKKILQNYKASEIKFTNQRIPPAMNIFRDKVLIISLGKKPTAVLIENKEIAKQYHALWGSIWEE